MFPIPIRSVMETRRNASNVLPVPTEKNASPEAHDHRTVPVKSLLRGRPALVNITNRPIVRTEICDSTPIQYPPDTEIHSDTLKQKHAVTLTAPALVPQSSSKQCLHVEGHIPGVKRSYQLVRKDTLEHVHSVLRLETAYSGSGHFHCSDGRFSESVYHLPSQCPVSKRLKFNYPDICALQADRHSIQQSPVDESEIDRRPFVSQLACDIVRAACADRIQLEHLLAECRRSDFVISALDRSPVDRMMEATDYIVGIMAYEQIRERKLCFHVPDFLATSKQPNLTTDMLTTLADWLIEVQDIFVCNHETIHLAWGLLYSFLGRGRPLARREIQLMACAALMVACKQEENKPARLHEFLYATDGVYERQEFIEAERQLLVAIDFAVHRPNPYVFLRRYARVLDAQSGLVQYMSRFLLEAGMHSHKICLNRDSRKAAAALWLARVVLRNPSYMEWARRADVRQLRQFIKSNPVAKSFYDNCPRAELKRPAIFQHELAICPDSAALDLSNCSSSSVISRTPSLVKCTIPPIMDSSSCSSPPEYIRHPEPLERVQSEPHDCPGLAEESIQLAQTCNSAPSESRVSCYPELDRAVKIELQALRSEEDQRAPYWPPILEHITGYKESELIPLAIRYHWIAIRLIAEVARGGRLAEGNPVSCLTNRSASDSRSSVDDETDGDSNQSTHQRSVSPGGHRLRRQAVSKYCSDAFLNVADAYPQLAFENFVPFFPSVQCPDSCKCFVCVNLVRRSW